MKKMKLLTSLSALGAISGVAVAACGCTWTYTEKEDEGDETKGEWMFPTYQSLIDYGSVAHFKKQGLQTFEIDDEALRSGDQQERDRVQKFLDQNLTAGIIADSLVLIAVFVATKEQFDHGQVVWNTENNKISADFTGFTSTGSEWHQTYTLEPYENYKFGQISMDLIVGSDTVNVSEMFHAYEMERPTINIPSVVIDYKKPEGNLPSFILPNLDFDNKLKVINGV